MEEFSIETPRKRFEEHLSSDENKRILFSGKFGSGKTYFLKKFFEENDDYKAIHLYPVNYSVASNEDIFELVKYDILFSLLENKDKVFEFDKLDIPHIQTLHFFATNNVLNILTPFVNLIPKLGKTLYPIADKLKELYDQYLKHHEEAQLDEKKTVINFLEQFTQKQGSVYEEDFFTQLICNLVDQLKETEEDNQGETDTEGESEVRNKKETVLIIDDLDRIDPEHIFRVLNVFAAHTDHRDDENKFDFDKIILVCDIENIRNIFKNRYGADVDFYGYMDKFYSNEVYSFSNIDGIKQKVYNQLKRLKQDEYQLYKGVSSPTSANICYILDEMINANLLTPRMLKRFLKKDQYTPNKNRLNLALKDSILHPAHIPCIQIIDFFLWLFEGYDEFINIVRRCKDLKSEIDKTHYSASLLTILGYEDHNFTPKDIGYNFTCTETSQSFTYLVGKQDHTHVQIHSIQNIEQKSRNKNKVKYIDGNHINYFGLLLETLIKCRDEKIIVYN
ncbi:P-loop NTPase fold protein [Rapidithrix thailandica]|uniref:P-loop NTPase fold protein n=1 Tax=Rapidithrix thailandica TaxID=413964 RepID=A0AAW9SC55_9BACT